MTGFVLSSSGTFSTNERPKSTRVNKGKSLLSFPENYVVLDLETTGLDPRFDEIIEFAAIRIRNNQQVDSFTTLIQPSSPVDDFITNLTGITNEMLASAPSADEVLPEILRFIGDDIVIGHNVNFDVNFLYDASEGKLVNNFVDTLRLARIIRKDLPNHKLCTLVDAFNIERPTSHRALADTEQTWQCFMALQQYAKDHDITFRPSRSFPHYVSAKSIVPNSTDFDENCPLCGKVVVFTGTLELGSRRDAMQLVADHGGICADSVTAKTNFLVLGNNDYCKSIKDGKSTKQKQAEKWILKGKDLKIISEQVFLDMLDDQDSLSLSEEGSITREDDPAEASVVKELHSKIITALTASPERYDLDAVVCSHRTLTSGPAYWALEILKRPCFRFRGVKKKVVEIAPFLSSFMEQSGLQFDTTKGSGDWTRALQSDFEQWLSTVPNEILVALYDKALESDGFDCCSHYQECSDLGHCVHPDIMFAGQCSYRKKLKSGVVFFGKNRNI